MVAKRHRGKFDPSNPNPYEQSFLANVSTRIINEVKGIIIESE